MIKNLINNKIYIGQSLDIYNRWKGHIKDLKNNRHHNKHLQNSWNKYGESIFEFEILKECFEEFLNKEEVYYINHYNCLNDKYGYNKRTGGDNSRLSDEAKTKLKLYNIGKKLTNETKKKISLGNKNKKRTEQQRINIVNGQKGKHLSDITKQKMSKSTKGRKVSQTVKDKISKGLKNSMALYKEKRKNGICNRYLQIYINKGYSLLNENIINNIKLDINNKKTFKQIAKDYNIAEYIVRKIIKNENLSIYLEY